MDTKRELPEDVLREIFRYCNGKTVINSRRVCRRWLLAADSLTEKDWQVICRNDDLYYDYSVVKKKNGLSWRDAFKAVHSWAKIHLSELSVHLLCKSAAHFIVLPNGIVAIPTSQRGGIFCDSIVYYDTESFKIYRKENLDFLFLPSEYTENEYFIVLVHERELWVILKETKEKFKVGTPTYSDVFFSSGPHAFKYVLTLIGKRLYFINSKDNIIYVSELKKVNGMPTVVTEPLENGECIEFDPKSVVAFALKKGALNILCHEGRKCSIITYHNEDLDCVQGMHFRDSDIFDSLKEFGFDWRSQQIYAWHNKFCENCSLLQFYSNGRVYLSSHNLETLHIRYTEHTMFGEDVLNYFLKSTHPNRIIKINSYIEQLDVIETSSKHKVLVLAEKLLYVLDFPIEIKNLSQRNKYRRTNVVMVKNEEGKLVPTKKIKIKSHLQL